MNFKVDFEELNRGKAEYDHNCALERESRYQRYKTIMLAELKGTEGNCIDKIKEEYHKHGVLPERPYEFYQCRTALYGDMLSSEKKRLQQELQSQYKGGIILLEYEDNYEGPSSFAGLVPEYARKSE